MMCERWRVRAAQWVPVLITAAVLSACGPLDPDDLPTPDAGPPAPVGLPVLGNGTHLASAVEMTELLSVSDGLDVPRDLALNPSRPGELWVVNRADDSVTIAFDLGEPVQSAIRRKDGAASHFMEESSSIAFGQPGTFATCGETRNTYDGQAPPNDFMGPALWSDDLDVFAVADPEGLGSHLDMLHESPLCMGIGWESANVYWVFDGSRGALVRYDFLHDHGPGFDDHSDGRMQRYVEGELRRVPDVASHVEYDARTKLVYAADSGNGRIVALDPSGATVDAVLGAKEFGTEHLLMTGAFLSTFVDAAAGEFVRPSGLAIAGDLMFVTDYETSRISAFRLSDGARVDWLDTGLPARSLAGIIVDDQGRLLIVDMLGNSVFRISARS